MNTIDGRLSANGDGLMFDAPDIHVSLPAPMAKAARAASLTAAVLGVRPEDLHLDPAGPIQAKIALIEVLGHERHLIAHLDDGQLLIIRQAVHETPPRDGEMVRLAAAPEALHLFDPASQERVDS